MEFRSHLYPMDIHVLSQRDSSLRIFPITVISVFHIRVCTSRLLEFESEFSKGREKCPNHYKNTSYLPRLAIEKKNLVVSKDTTIDSRCGNPIGLFRIPIGIANNS